jgi:uncharacterized protein YcbK (DUF882 family)
MEYPLWRGSLARRAAATLGIVVVAVPVTRLFAGADLSHVAHPISPPASAARAALVNVPEVSRANDAVLRLDSLMGRSGRVRVRLILGDEVEAYPLLGRLFGDSARLPGTRALPDSLGFTQFSFITMRSWREKSGSRINGYNVGWWPAERRAVATNYENPDGFVEVRPEHADLAVSAHFRLRDFVTHDQAQVWPKYLVLREELLDKLELVLTTLEAQGVPTHHVKVLSGFRSPQYNSRGFGEGMAQNSRHMYGDAADLIIDADRNGRMDDLNRDGRVDFEDTGIIQRAVERVERAYPELVGGLGLYHAIGPSGPFAHIDVRGTRARWTNSKSKRPVNAFENWRPNEATRVTRAGGCVAEGASAVLCAGVR